MNRYHIVLRIFKQLSIMIILFCGCLSISGQGLADSQSYTSRPGWPGPCTDKPCSDMLSRALSDSFLATIDGFGFPLQELVGLNNISVCYDGSPYCSNRAVGWWGGEFNYDSIYWLDSASSHRDSIVGIASQIPLRSFAEFLDGFGNNRAMATVERGSPIMFVFASLSGNRIQITTQFHLVGLVSGAQHPQPMSTEWNDQLTGAKFTYVLRDCEWHLESEVYQWNLKCSHKAMAEIDRLKRNGIEFY